MHPRSQQGPVSVSELTFALKGHIESRFGGVRVHGEILSARKVSSGHCYFTLKDERSQLPCVMWRSTLARLPMQIRDGMQVEATGDVQVYPPHGRYQLIVRRLSDAGVGRLLEALEQLKRRYHAEGLFDDGRKRALPLLPRRVGIVTAATGAAVRDVIRATLGRYPADIVVSPARVQGEGAAEDIARALRAVARLPGVDVIICGRGGGSLQDLWAFNEDPVVRAIAASPVPVVSAVGHEVDTTLADLVADARAATPTAAGTMVVPSLDELHRGLRDKLQRLAHQLDRRVASARQRLTVQSARLPDPARIVAERQQRLDDRVIRLDAAATRHLEAQRARLAHATTRLRGLHPVATLRAARARAETLRDRLDRAFARTLDARRARLGEQRRALTILSPTASLGRGYAIVRGPDARVVRDARDVRDGASVDIIVHRGALEATITARHPTPEDR